MRRALLLLLACSLVLTACAPTDAYDRRKDERAKAKADATAERAAQRKRGIPPGTLILNGEVVTPGGRGTGEPRATGAGPATAAPGRPGRSRTGFVAEEAPEPPLLGDGTLDDGPDPFGRVPVPSQPTPIEDDAEATRELATWAGSLRRVEQDAWATWLDRRSPEATRTGPSDVLGALVRVHTLRCGGARTAATGVVLADETVVTTVHAIESPQRRIRVQQIVGGGPRIPAIIKYVDVDDDVAVLHVPGLLMTPIGTHVPQAATPQRAFAFGLGAGGAEGRFQRAPVFAAMEEQSLAVEQPDGFAQKISDRSVYPLIGAIDDGFSGGVVAATNDPDMRDGWGFHGLVRARAPYRSTGAGIAVPSRIVQEAITASERLDEWFELRPSGCPQWRRPRTR